MYRILGDAYYHFGQYHQAVEAFTGYLDRDHSAPRRDALYMLGLSYYQTKVYSKAAEMLGQVTTANDALTQNAYLHMGLLLPATGRKEQGTYGVRTGSRLQRQPAD